VTPPLIVFVIVAGIIAAWEAISGYMEWDGA
jgi:hypothetical protein